ncbi:glycoside hydrolase family 108 protein [Vibrio misgurnus]|uniref:glycoside hydrolase family 108 protein n=1 Tax=Vibrio misgurnus TaxID=2993714 RepID=UPI0023F9A8BA|nr:glycosyl hydrolase 108 family protein [Vibrio sp. VCS]
MFDRVFERVVLHEGGYQADPRDRGNWTGGRVGVGVLKGTNRGIAAMTYPHLDIERLTDEQIKAIYFEDWWLKLGMASFRPAMQYQLFDAAVQHGWSRAVKMLQHAVGETPDGVIGPKTLKATQAMEINDLIMGFLAYRIQFYTQVSTFNDYGRGWMQRVAQCLLYAMQDNHL